MADREVQRYALKVSESSGTGVLAELVLREQLGCRARTSSFYNRWNATHVEYEPYRARSGGS
jgi:hypothetical protein